MERKEGQKGKKQLDVEAAMYGTSIEPHIEIVTSRDALDLNRNAKLFCVINSPTPKTTEYNGLKAFRQEYISVPSLLQTPKTNKSKQPVASTKLALAS